MFSVLMTKEGIIIPLMILSFLISLGIYFYLMHKMYFDPKKSEKLNNQQIIEGVNKSFSTQFKTKDF